MYHSILVEEGTLMPTNEQDSTKDKKIGPWTRHCSQQIYDNPWISVSHEQVTTPGGSEGIYGRVHFKNRALGIVPLDADNNTWLVGQHRYTLDQFSWEVPMGGGPLTDSALKAAQRELREETGLHADEWVELFRADLSNSVTDERGTVFLARGLHQGEQQLEASEGDLVVKKLPFNEALDMVLNGQITDLMSVAALLAVDRLLSNEAQQA
jgi:8-oxo-dGDP phosphatase